MKMYNQDPYTLPTIDFIGGSTQEIECVVYAHDGIRPFDLTGCTAFFSLINYVNKAGSPLLYKEMQIEVGSNNTFNSLRLQLSAVDTINLVGKYIYQISIHDSFGNVDNRQGVMYINNNINRNFNF